MNHEPHEAPPMADELEQLNNPWLIAAWPGMGSVAVLAASRRLFDERQRLRLERLS